MKYIKHSKYRKTLIPDVCKQFLKISKTNFTLLRTSEMYYLKKSKSTLNLLTVFIIALAYSLSSILERSKIYISSTC